LPQVLERIKNGVTTYYIYGQGLLYQITEAPTGTNTVTYHYDARGSTIALTGDNGLVTDRMEYSLYATMTYHIGTCDTPFLFNGRFGVMTDPNGLLYMKARYYNPFLCRFLNPDPLGFSGGMNFYAYANGNPASMADPAGTDASSVSTSANGDNITYQPNSTPQDLSDPFGIKAAQAALDAENDWFGKTLDALAYAGAFLDMMKNNFGQTFFGTTPAQTDIALGGLAPEFGVADATAGSQMTTVIGSGQDVKGFMQANGFQSVSDAQQAGYNIFDWQSISGGQYELNVQNALWFNNALQRGDNVLMVTDPEAWGSFLNNLREGYPANGSGFLDTEIPMLQNYQNVNVIKQFAPPPAP
jgi:RHS repeat-associated protein